MLTQVVQKDLQQFNLVPGLGGTGGLKQEEAAFSHVTPCLTQVWYSMDLSAVN